MEGAAADHRGRTGKRRDQLERTKSACLCRRLAFPEDHACKSTTRPVGMHEESADAGGIAARLHFAVHVFMMRIATEHGFPLAPPAAPSEWPVIDLVELILRL